MISVTCARQIHMIAQIGQDHPIILLFQKVEFDRPGERSPE